jgi:hypothetical protein
VALSRVKTTVTTVCVTPLVCDQAAGHLQIGPRRSRLPRPQLERRLGQGWQGRRAIGLDVAFPQHPDRVLHLLLRIVDDPRSIVRYNCPAAFPTHARNG